MIMRERATMTARRIISSSLRNLSSPPPTTTRGSSLSKRRSHLHLHLRVMAMSSSSPHLLQKLHGVHPGHRGVVVCGHPLGAEQGGPHLDDQPADEGGVQTERRAEGGRVEEGHRHRAIRSQVQMPIDEGEDDRRQPRRFSDGVRREAGGGKEAEGHQAGAGEAWTESEALHRGEGSAAGGAQGALRGHQHGVHGAVERGRVEQRVRQRRCLHDAQRLGNPRLRRPGEHGLRCPRRRLRRWRNSRPHPRRRHRLPRPAGRHRRVHCLRRKARGP
mmetsp:Transcript_9186/g.19891  ORF Transcript_9186/g.19891 Transcript_9186/m.19891 type:complete len:274 (-) Transcript_9186:485-1306(-)